MFGKKKKQETKVNTISSFDKIHTASLISGESIYEEMLKDADYILNDIPLLINFNKITTDEEANYILAFLSGVSYAKGGNVYQINELTHLFTTEEAMKDGSIEKYLKQVGC